MYLYFSFPLTLSSHWIQFPNLSSSIILPTSPLRIHYSPYQSLTSLHPLFSLPLPHLSSSTILPTSPSPLSIHYSPYLSSSTILPHLFSCHYLTSPAPLFSLTSLPATTSPLLLHYYLYQFLTTPFLHILYLSPTYGSLFLFSNK